jgi:uncharacterized protein YbaP (TraB family)
MRRWLAGLLFGLCLAITAAAETPSNSLWRGTLNDHDISILGSIHALRPADYPLPEAINDAYQRAETVVFELDLANLDPQSISAAVTSTGLLTQGSLPQLFEPKDWRRADELARSMNIALDPLAGLKPWLAAMTIVQIRMAQLDYDPELGVDQHFATLAQADGKPVIGLETLLQQLAMLDSMPTHEQQALFLQSLEEAQEMGAGLGELVEAWRQGNSAALAEELGGSFTEFPELYQQLVVARNKAWSEQILAMDATTGNLLVVVGALHLVGPNSLIGMLEKRGLVLNQQ